MSKVRWGLLVTEGYANVAMAANAKSETTEFVAVWAGDAEQSREYAKAHGIARSHGSAEELLADEEVDAVFVALHPVDHVEWTIKALQAGKHAMCEKPIGLSVEDVERVFDAAEVAGRHCVESVMFRHHPQTRLAKELVDSGRIGDVMYVYVACTAAVPPDYFRRSRELGGGAMLDLGVFAVSAIRYFAGEPTRVYAEEVRRGPGAADHSFSATLRLPNGVLGQFVVGQDLARRDFLHIVGTKGRVVIPQAWFPVNPESVEIDLQGPVPLLESTKEYVPIDPEGIYRLDEPFHISRIQFDEVSSALAAGTAPPFGRAEAVAQARVVAALQQSAAGAVPVELT
ncbi:Gfo/Idh/MocA family protein [Streptomyces litchfieldiae]|uniref:Gfo/Idh/MocA family oxidoreductase n=1 Tax=Streptomyces litchfieldiae TaxID=3075543 RepID=A0ABU2MW02_9ACTN|nr:Gfo/Idh/MocA family oxidoreductase [Streptomyces sp. DSM 44938]MDT0345817.1 Gfo/Idh/MocA family oxidoreductase [Streptomyces sp. DSM 44938]